MLKKLLLVAFAVVIFITTAIGQGVTTSSIKGKITDETGKALPAATIVALHVPSGTQYGTITQDDGRFHIQGMRIGGPYKITATFIGYKESFKENISLQLNQTTDLEFSLTVSEQTLNEVVVKGGVNELINSDRTGSATFINSKEISSLPSIARSQQDFTRMTPQANGNSFGGRNTLYNNFSLDGSIFNNSFGLDYATPGGQSDAQPVSLDAIEQLQVSLAPFDVREGGFTGAGVNAVTKSGTNMLKGTAYYFTRNEKMTGSKVRGNEASNVDFATNLFGVTLGGPIVKNKLFFFVNAEGERRNQLAHGFVANNGDGTNAANETNISKTDLDAIQAHLRNVWGYEPGKYDGYNHETFNNKMLAKIDWNINKSNQLMVRYNYLDAWKDILPHPEAVIGRGPTSYRLPFENSSYRIFNKINSVVSELNSRFGNVSNKLMIGYTQFRDQRQPKSVPFPVVDIFINGNLAVTAGSEMFSTSNVLNQDVFQFTDNFTYYLDKHSLTAGVNYEQFKFENSFNLFYYPWVASFSVSDFLANNIRTLGRM